MAAGHPLTAQAGARVLREGGNAVDAAVGAMLTSFATEPLLTGLGAGGYMLVAGAGREPALLDFFVQAPTRVGDGSEAALGRSTCRSGTPLRSSTSGPRRAASTGRPPACARPCGGGERFRWKSSLVPAARLAREGVVLNAGQAYVAKILAELLSSTPECAALWAPEGHILREGEVLHNDELGEALLRLGRHGAEPFYRGDIAVAVCDWLRARGGSLRREDLADYHAIGREPVRMRYRDREVLTNPPPSAGGTLLAYALALLDRGPAPPTLSGVVEAMRAAQTERTPEFVEGLSEEGFLEKFLATRLGSTTHISVLDAEGCACSATCTNGEGSGVVVPGTGMHINNVMGEEDLNPLGFHRHPAGRRMPSMMAPSIVMRDGEVELVLGSAGSNRIRSALLQTIVGVVDHGMSARNAVTAPRVHFEDGVLYAEPGIDERELARTGVRVVSFEALNLFFGGVQAVQRRGETLTGAGDPRRGGVAVSA